MADTGVLDDLGTVDTTEEGVFVDDIGDPSRSGVRRRPCTSTFSPLRSKA
jgi:hypothetical protein